MDRNELQYFEAPTNAEVGMSAGPRKPPKPTVTKSKATASSEQNEAKESKKNGTSSPKKNGTEKPKKNGTEKPKKNGTAKPKHHSY